MGDGFPCWGHGDQPVACNCTGACLPVEQGGKGRCSALRAPMPKVERPKVDSSIGLTEEEKDILRDWWDEDTTSSVESSFPILSRLIAERERLSSEKAWDEGYASAKGYDLTDDLDREEFEDEYCERTNPYSVEEPTALAWTPDVEMIRGALEFKRLWPDKWEMWLKFCREEQARGPMSVNDEGTYRAE